MSVRKPKSCPCGWTVRGSKINYLQCCGQYIEHATVSPTAEALMRSRYSAYVLGHEAYLLHSWHISTRPGQLDLGDEPIEWLKLEVLATNQGTPADKQGTVEFIAYYQLQGKKHQIHEISRFMKQNSEWFYVDGVVDA